MDVVPILAAMRRNKFGAVLIAAQMAVTLTILCNAAFIVQRRVQLIERPSGVNENDIFALDNEWIGEPKDLAPRIQADVAALRALPGVIDAYASNTYPLTNSGSTGIANLRADQRQPTSLAAVYFVDDHALQTLGLKLIAGRNFTATEVRTLSTGVIPQTLVSAIIITRDLAEKLFPKRDAVGRFVYLDTSHRAQIVGVIDKLQVPWTQAGGWGSTFNEDSMLEPLQLATPGVVYIVRVHPRKLTAVMRAVQTQLFAVNPSRIVTQVRSFREARQDAYRDDRGFVIVLLTVCLITLAMTAFGIVGLTSYWVSQRRRQIGIRRVLGGTRGAVIGYFQTENLMIALVGTAVGSALALGLNLWAADRFEMSRLPYFYPAIGAAIVVVLGQGAALWPALRASRIPPALAARSA